MKPIIFNTESVKAILGGRKTVTRRVIKPQPLQGRHGEQPIVGWIEGNDEKLNGRWAIGSYILKRTYEVGMELWVRETWCPYPEEGTGRVYFKATDERRRNTAKSNSMKPHLYNWRPSIFMPKWASRITLRITDIRVERVQEIRTRQIYKEGCPVYSVEETIKKSYLDELLKIPKEKRAMAMRLMPKEAYIEHPLPKEWFKALWDSINEKRGYSWESNPWVWIIEFERVK